ncbi:MAG TPA: DUF167 family protein [Methylomirabilota bacterium]|nr:DUF167 family protein [Methylomirabilota bacterium]
MSSPFLPAAEGVRVLVRLSPGSSAARVLGLAQRPDGRSDLKVAVKAPPEGGRANAELIAFLADAWDVPKRTLTLVAGAVDRRKTLFLAGDPGPLLARLEVWLDEAARGASRR